MADRGLVERAQRGDRAAYEALARGRAQDLFLVCHRILRDMDRAEDAVQHTLVRMWRELPGLRDPDRFEAWTYRIAVNACYSELRHDRRRLDAVRRLPVDPDNDPPDRAVADREALDHAFRRLSPEHRAVVVLRYFTGLTLGEIAEVTGVPPGTVASRLHYALRDLRIELDDGGAEALVQEGVPA